MTSVRIGFGAMTPVPAAAVERALVETAGSVAAAARTLGVASANCAADRRRPEGVGVQRSLGGVSAGRWKAQRFDKLVGMYLDQLPSIRVTELRRSGALTPDMTRTAVTIQGDDGTPVSREVQVVRVRMRSGVVFLQFLCGQCGRRAQVLRLHAGRIMCGRCTGLRYWCEGKPAVRRAQHRIERLKATRFHGSPVSRRPGRTMERRAQLEASLRRSEAVVRRHFAGRIMATLQAEKGREVDASIPDA
jgi:hypothetical protein